MNKERSADRLIFFTDAVAAIAITLLILPLVDLVPHAHSVEQFFHDYLSETFAFVLSFFIIARLWMANHEILSSVERTTPLLIWLDLLWAFTIVVLPLPTALVANLHSERYLIVLYIGTMTLSSLLLTAIAFYLHWHPHLESRTNRTPLVRLWGIGSTTCAFLVALAISFVFPHLTYYPLLLLFLTPPLDRIVRPRLQARDARRRAEPDAAAISES